MSEDENQSFDLGSALARIGNIPTQGQLGQAAQDEGAAYRGRLAQEQPQAPENPTFNGAMIEPITPLSPQSQPPYDYSAANLESGRNISRQSFVDSYNKQAAAEPRVDPLNRIASSLAGRPVTPYNANPSNYRQLTPSEEAEKYRSEQSKYASLAAGIATPELASATGLARFAPGANQLNMFLPARAQQVSAAEKLEQQGVNPDNILRQTGAHRDVDGRWMREISDASSRVTPEAQQFLKDYESAAGPATDVFEHPELYKQAPGLKKYQMELEQEPEFIKSDHPDYFPGFQEKAEAMEQRGYSPKEIFKQSNMVRTPEGEWTQRYFPLGWHSGEEQNIRVAGANPEDFRKVILHESSHAVDKAMGRPSYGASDDRIYQDIAKLPKEEVIARAQASRAAGSPWAPNLENYKDNWEGFLRQQASDEYMRNAAEARARNVETRRNMSQAERLNTHPFKTMDIPPEQQIVGYETTPGSSQRLIAGPLAKTANHEALAIANDSSPYINQEDIDRHLAGYEMPTPEAYARIAPSEDRFLFGDKPVYAGGDRQHIARIFGEDKAKQFDQYPSLRASYKNGPPMQIWHKPGEDERAMAIANEWSSIPAASPEAASEATNRHLSKLYGYSDAEIDKFFAGERQRPPQSASGSSVSEPKKPQQKKHGGSVSEKTYALLHRIKRQDGGAATPSDNAPPQDERDIPTIDPAPLIPKAVSDLAPDLSRNVAGTPTYGGGINPFESKQAQNWEPLLYGIPYLGFTKMAQQLPSVARTINETEEGMRVPGMMQGIYDKVSNLPSNASEIISGMWNNRWPSSEERVEAAYQGMRTKNAELYKLDPDGYIQEVSEHALSKPANPGESIEKDEYMRGVPLDIRDKVYRRILQQKGGPGAFETATDSPSQATKNPGGFETQVVPSQARGGAVSDKTNQLLAKLNTQKSA